MRRLSIEGTFHPKRLAPIACFGTLGCVVVFSSLAMIRDKKFEPKLVVVPLAMAAVAYILMNAFIFDLVDEVWDDGDALVVKNKGKEERIPFTNVTDVTNSITTKPPRITVSFRRPTLFGDWIAFCPERSWPVLPNPIVAELRKRIKEANRAG